MTEAELEDPYNLHRAAPERLLDVAGTAFREAVYCHARRVRLRKRAGRGDIDQLKEP
jgi:hypothetical protein